MTRDQPLPNEPPRDHHHAKDGKKVIPINESREKKKDVEDDLIKPAWTVAEDELLPEGIEVVIRIGRGRRTW